MTKTLVMCCALLFALAACTHDRPANYPTRPRIGPHELAALHRSGDTKFVPSSDLKQRIEANHFYHVSYPVKVCINADGEVDGVSVPDHGFEELEQAIDARIRTWRYAPYLQDGIPTAVCSSVTIEYRQEPGKYGKGKNPDRR